MVCMNEFSYIAKNLLKSILNLHSRQSVELVMKKEMTRRLIAASEHTSFVPHVNVENF